MAELLTRGQKLKMAFNPYGGSTDAVVMDYIEQDLPLWTVAAYTFIRKEKGKARAQLFIETYREPPGRSATYSHEEKLFRTIERRLEILTQLLSEFEEDV